MSELHAKTIGVQHVRDVILYDACKGSPKYGEENYLLLNDLVSGEEAEKFSRIVKNYCSKNVEQGLKWVSEAVKDLKNPTGYARDLISLTNPRAIDNAILNFLPGQKAALANIKYSA